MEENNLQNKLLNFKKVTEELILTIVEEDESKVNDLFIKRQQIINEIDKLQYAKEDFKEIASDIGLLEACKKLEETFQSKRDELRKKMNELKNVQSASKSYMNNSNSIKNLFSKSV